MQDCHAYYQWRLFVCLFCLYIACFHCLFCFKSIRIDWNLFPVWHAALFDGNDHIFYPEITHFYWTIEQTDLNQFRLGLLKFKHYLKLSIITDFSSIDRKFLMYEYSIFIIDCITMLLLEHMNWLRRALCNLFSWHCLAIQPPCFPDPIDILW